MKDIKLACLVAAFCLGTVNPMPAQTFKTLLDFDGLDGADPASSLTQGLDGNLYGTTYSGGPGGKHDFGTLFRITAEGKMNVGYAFCPQPQNGCPNGFAPVGGLLLASDGNFYGTTEYGGLIGVGTVFKVTPEGELTTLYSFCPQGLADCTDGANPLAGLVEGPDGNFYGTTEAGGVTGYTCNIDTSGCGTVFRITPNGELTTLYRFCSQTKCSDGFFPEGVLVQGADGSFYGTTSQGGVHSLGALQGGTIFRITPSGQLTTVYGFCEDTNCTDGAFPAAGLVEGSGGNFYGTTEYGGAPSYMGTVFKITPAGVLSTLYRFCENVKTGNSAPPVLPYQCPDGSNPTASLTLATDGAFYGTTVAGGFVKNAQQDCNSLCGTVFRITPEGQFTTLHRFDGSDGNDLVGGLLQATDGAIYGTTYLGGTFCFYCGTVFRLSLGLKPFVLPNPMFGKVGRTIDILGTNLTASTSVTFNGTPATFDVIANTLIKAQVPSGATSGTIVVSSPSGPLGSNVAFQVLP